MIRIKEINSVVQGIVQLSLFQIKNVITFQLYKYFLKICAGSCIVI